MTLRALTIGIGAVYLAGAMALAILGQMPRGLVIWLSINGAVVIGLVVMERSGYRPKHRSDGGWQATGERFHDPTTGKLTEVDYNPTTGERDYKEV